MSLLHKPHFRFKLKGSILYQVDDFAVACEDNVPADSSTLLSRWLQILGELCRNCKRILMVLPHGGDISVAADLISSLICGSVRSAQLEYPGVEMVLLHVDCASAALSVSAEVSRCVEFELTHWDGELEVNYSNGHRLVKRYNVAHSLSEAVTDDAIDGTYIVTGGLGGLGLLSARVLVSAGAKRIVLVSRSGKVAYEGQGLEAELSWLTNDSGADVRIIRCDVSDEESVVAMLDEVRGMGDGISGIIHAAGVLRDGLLRGGGAVTGCRDVWMSKAHSAWLLHTHTQKDDLCHFVVFSSITSALGNPGQSAYGAANSYLDALVEHRVRSGLCGASVQWPAISGVGMAAATGVALDGLSLDRLSVTKVLSEVLHLVRIRGNNNVNVDVHADGGGGGCVVTVVPSGLLDYIGGRVGQQFHNVQKLQRQANQGGRLQSSPNGVANVVSRAGNASGVVYTVDDVRERVRRVVVSVMGSDTLSDEVQLMDQGLDSLGIIELGSLLKHEFCVGILPDFIFKFGTVNDLILPNTPMIKNMAEDLYGEAMQEINRPFRVIPQTVVTISSVMQDYLTDMRMKQKNIGTQRKLKRWIEQFHRIMGDLAISEIKPKHGYDYIRTVLTDHPNRSNKTLKDYVWGVQNFLKYCLENGFIDINPFTGLDLSKYGESSEQTYAFSREDLKTIFSYDWEPQEYLFMSILATTGMRPSEVGNLTWERFNDTEYEGIRFFTLLDTDEEKVQVKNQSSIREVPIHTSLKLPPKSSGRLFNYRKDDEGLSSTAVGHIINPVIRKLVLHPNKSIRSFRRTFKTLLRDLSVGEEVHDAITGHTIPSASRKNYGGMGMQVKFDAISKLDISFL